MAGGLLLWLAYTRLYFPLRGVHATLPACPFLVVTGHPCPFCGGTRSFAYVWHGDFRRALLMYPLGPLLFGATVIAIAVLFAAAAARREFRWTLRPPAGRWLVAVALVPLGVSWALKLTLLPN